VVSIRRAFQGLASEKSGAGVPVAPFLRLKFERIKRNLSQQDLANKTGIPQPTISDIERRRINPTEQELFQLANALLISPPGVLMRECSIQDPAPEHPEETTFVPPEVEAEA
jgi:transcriptional regulator with XRE-family HTH domain